MQNPEWSYHPAYPEKILNNKFEILKLWREMQETKEESVGAFKEEFLVVTK